MLFLVPPLTCYCLRYSSPNASLLMPDFWSYLWKPIICYSWWQIVYVLKTEILDRKRFDEDTELITSLRWMTNHKPHPIYKWVRKQSWGHYIPSLAIIIIVQLIYTIITIVPTFFFLQYQRLNELWLIFLFAMACWNGSRFYFEIMMERARKEKEAEEPKKKESALVLYSSTRRFFTFSLWLLLALGGNKLIIERLVMA